MARTALVVTKLMAPRSLARRRRRLRSMARIFAQALLRRQEPGSVDDGRRAQQGGRSLQRHRVGSRHAGVHRAQDAIEANALLAAGPPALAAPRESHQRRPAPHGLQWHVPAATAATVLRIVAVVAEDEE